MVAIHENDLTPLLNSFNDGICCLSAQGEVRCYNAAAQEHWGGEQYLTTMLPTLPAVTRGLAGEEVAHELIEMEKKRTLLVNVLPMYGGTDIVTSIVIISHDVSESVQLELRAESALRVLSEAAFDTTHVEQFEEAIRRVAALLPQLESVDHSIAFRLEGTNLIPLAFFGHSDEQYEQWHSELIAAKLSTEGVLKYPGSPYLHTLQLARPITVDYSDTSLYSNPHNLQAAIYAPILMDGSIVGLLGIERERPRDELGIFFPQWSIDLLAALARLTSMNLEKNALLNAVGQLQDEVEEAQKLLNQKEEFLSLAAHELKNPLTAIRGQAQVMRRRLNRSIAATLAAEDEETHDLIKGLESVERQTHRIEQIINTLLSTSRIDLDRLELRLQPVDLVQLAKHTLEAQLPFNRNHELCLFVEDQAIQLGTNKQESVPVVVVQGDESRLEEILANLLSNATRYSPQGGPITVSVRHLAGGFAEIAVQDQGIGIPREAQAHLAERFYRAENARHVSGQGLGLGIYLVNALAIHHGGHLSVESEGIPGKGSTFRIALPLHQ